MEIAAGTRLIFANFGDIPSIAAIMALHSFKDGEGAVKVEAVLPKCTTNQWLWTGKYRAKGGREWPMAIAILRRGRDAAADLKAFGFDRGASLRIVGNESRNRRPDGRLVEIVEDDGPAAHLRDFARYPLKDFERQVALELLSSFIVAGTPSAGEPVSAEAAV